MQDKATILDFGPNHEEKFRCPLTGAIMIAPPAGTEHFERFKEYMKDATEAAAEQRQPQNPDGAALK